MNIEDVSSATSVSDEGSGVSSPISPEHPVERNFQQIRRWFASQTFVPSWLPSALRPWFVGYLLASILPVLMIFLSKLLLYLFPAFSFSEAPNLLLVVILSWLWGSGPGILASLVSTLLLIFFRRGFEDGSGIIFYLIIGLMIGLMARQRRQMKETRQRGSEATRQQLYNLFNQVPMPISVLRGPEQRFAFINPLTQQAMGKREVLGKSIREVLPEYASQGILALVDEVYTTGKALTVRELRAETMHYEDGLTVPVERYFNVVYQPLFVEQGVVDGIMIFNVDITEQVQASNQKERLMLEREQERDHLREVLVHEQELRQVAESATQQIQAIFEAIADPVFIIDLQGNLQRMNRAARELLAIPEKVRTRELNVLPRFFELYDGQDHYLPKEVWPQVLILEGTALYGSTAVDIVMHTHDGRVLDLSVTGAPLRGEDGTIHAAVMACRDITERRNLELRLRQTEQQTRESLQALLVLAESLVSVPMTGEEDGEVVASAMQDVAQRLAGLLRSVLNCKRISITILDPHTQELRSLAVVGLPPEQERQWYERRPGFYLSDRVMETSIEEQFSTGNVVVVDMQKAPFDGQANPYGIKVMLMAPMRIGTRLIGILSLDHGGEEWVFSDSEKMLAKAVAELAALILERERLLEERTEAQANMLALQEANHLKDEFIGVAGHELRTPLTTVKASVQLARRQITRLLKLETTLSPEAEKLIAMMQTLLERAERQVGMQNRLVNDLLDVSRIETGHLELHPELGDLVMLIHEVVEDLQALTPERRILFDRSNLGEVLVLVDADRLRQVMSNYLSNALKYSAAEQPVVVHVVLLDTEVRVEVEDRGPGLTAIQQQRIWERFYRVPGIEVKSGSGVGLGLGLHITRMIIERHGGRVGVRSVKGQGATFWLVLARAE